MRDLYKQADPTQSKGKQLSHTSFHHSPLYISMKIDSPPLGSRDREQRVVARGRGPELLFNELECQFGERT